MKINDLEAKYFLVSPYFNSVTKDRYKPALTTE